MSIRLRQAVRALVIDDAERLLLVRFVGLPGGDRWATPGGGLEPGESMEAAIARELREEVGLDDAEMGPAFWTRTHLFPLAPGIDGQQETFFLVRVRSDQLGPPTLSATELLAEGVSGSRWWTVSDLKRAKSVRFAPTRLPALYGCLLNDALPQSPIDVGE